MNPIARLLRACADRIEAGEPWREALADYGLVLLPTAANRAAPAPGQEEAGTDG